MRFLLSEFLVFSFFFEAIVGESRLDEGLKFREIAKILGISENTAKSRLYYGLKALRKMNFIEKDIR